MTRKMYQLTEKDSRKATRNARAAASKRAWADEKRATLGKRFGIECREAARQELKGDPEYIRGIWQGRLDRHFGLDYSEERTSSAYNMGYYNGYTNYERDRRGGMTIPTQYLEE